VPDLILHDFTMPHDPRDPYVKVDPDADPWLTLDAGVRDGAKDASIHRAQTTQRRERDVSVDSIVAKEGIDLLRQQAIDSNERERLAGFMPPLMPLTDRRDAAAVAVRLHDPRWQMVSRYHAADAALVELRKFFGDGHGYATDSELRALADRLAGVTHMARLRVWTGQVAVTARQWAKAALGILSVTEER
jgi:hypothetical protein